MLPLVAGTAYTVWHIGKMYEPLARFVNLSQACEVVNGDGTNDVDQLRKGHPVTKSQTHLNRGRYGHRGDGVYAVAKVRAFSPPTRLLETCSLPHTESTDSVHRV